jgi:hypothetical protein
MPPYFRLLKTFVAGIVIAGSLIAATQPSFYARREYGNNGGCASSTSLAVGDINGDGIPDIVCGGGQFLYGKGNGTFILSGYHNDLGGTGLALVDLNGDGILDLILTTITANPTWGFAVAFGDGKGSFESPTDYPTSDREENNVAVGDFNGDGVLDAVTIGEQGIWLMTGKGRGVFNSPVLEVPGVGCDNCRFSAVDMNGDGKLDLVVAVSNGVAILFGNGDGTFQPPVTYGGSPNGCNIPVADINSDGYLDVLCSTVLSTSSVIVFPGKKGGKLGTPYDIPLPNYEDVEVGDVNGDGIPDLVSDSVYIAYGLGHGKFSTPVYFPVAGTAIGNASQVVLAHLRSPKLLDIETNDYFVRVSVLLNKGNGSFIEGTTTSIPSGMGCVTQSDFNDDGIPDLGYIQNGNTFTVVYGTGKAAAPFAAGPSTPFPPPASGGSCFTNAGDINGDGIPDFLIFETGLPGTPDTIYPLMGVGAGNFVVGAPFTFGGYSQLYLVDVNGDGKADLISGDSNQVFYGNGDGTFGAPVTLVTGLANPISQVTWGDLNGDGKTDLVVQVEDGLGTYVLLSNPSGGFTQTLVGDKVDTFVVALGDLNGDGFPDLLMGSALNTMALFLNDGKGNFTYREELAVPGLLETFAPVILDVNGDGLPDIAVADGGDIAVLVNQGNLAFGAPQLFGQTAGALFFGNWNGQSATAGMPDIMMPNGSGQTTMLLNETK